MGRPVRLDLGCGDKREEGWIRVDFPVTRKSMNNDRKAGDTYDTDPDVPCDIKAVPLPDGCADEARAIHVIEHFYPWEALNALKEWVRLIKPGGEIALECPCLDKILKLFEVPNCPPPYTYWGLYGDPRYNDPLMMHRWCYTEAQLSRLMLQAGLVDIRAEPVRFHAPIRDMRLVGTKPPEGSRIVLPTDQ